jgi:hypothetical protein
MRMPTLSVYDYLKFVNDRFLYHPALAKSGGGSHASEKEESPSEESASEKEVLLLLNVFLFLHVDKRYPREAVPLPEYLYLHDVLKEEWPRNGKSSFVNRYWMTIGYESRSRKSSSEKNTFPIITSSQGRITASSSRK